MDKMSKKYPLKNCQAKTHQKLNSKDFFWKIESLHFIETEDLTLQFLLILLFSIRFHVSRLISRKNSASQDGQKSLNFKQNVRHRYSRGRSRCQGRIPGQKGCGGRAYQRRRRCQDRKRRKILTLEKWRFVSHFVHFSTVRILRFYCIFALLQ